MKSVVRRVRSKSPFRRQRRAEELIHDIRQVEIDYRARLCASPVNDKVEESDRAVEIVLEPTAVVTPPVEVREALIKKARSNSVKKDSPDLRTLSTASSTTDSPNSPKNRAQASKRKSFRDRFMNKNARSAIISSVPSSSSSARKKRNASATNDTVYKTSSSQDCHTVRARGRSRTRARGRSGSSAGRVVKSGRTSALVPSDLAEKLYGDDVVHPNAREHKKEEDYSLHRTPRIMAARLGESSMQDSQPVVAAEETFAHSCRKPFSIQVSGREGSHISELSTPAAIRTSHRQRSLGEDSIAHVRRALRRVEKELTQSRKKASRELIAKTLLSVADTLENTDDRETMRHELGAMIESEDERVCERSNHSRGQTRENKVSSSSAWKPEPSPRDQDSYSRHSERRRKRCQTRSIRGSIRGSSPTERRPSHRQYDPNEDDHSSSTFGRWVEELEDDGSFFTDANFSNLFGITSLFRDMELDREWSDFAKHRNSPGRVSSRKNRRSSRDNPRRTTVKKQEIEPEDDFDGAGWTSHICSVIMSEDEEDRRSPTSDHDRNSRSGGRPISRPAEEDLLSLSSIESCQYSKRNDQRVAVGRQRSKDDMDLALRSFHRDKQRSVRFDEGDTTPRQRSRSARVGSRHRGLGRQADHLDYGCRLEL